MAKVVIDRVGTIYVNEGEDKTLNVRLATTKGRVALVGANLLGLVTASGAGRLESRPNAAGGRTWSYVHRKVVGEYDTETERMTVTSVSVAPADDIGDQAAFLAAVKDYAVRQAAPAQPAPAAVAPAAQPAPAASEPTMPF